MARAPRAPRSRPPCMTWTPAAAPELAALVEAEPADVEEEESLESAVAVVLVEDLVMVEFEREMPVTVPTGT